MWGKGCLKVKDITKEKVHVKKFCNFEVKLKSDQNDMI